MWCPRGGERAGLQDIEVSNFPLWSRISYSQSYPHFRCLVVWRYGSLNPLSARPDKRADIELSTLLTLRFGLDMGRQHRRACPDPTTNTSVSRRCFESV